MRLFIVSSFYLFAAFLFCGIMMTEIPCLLLLMISFVLDKTDGTHKGYYSSKTPYKPPPSTLVLPSPPMGFEIVCTQMVARHGCRALEGRKYDKLTMALWTQAKEEDALTEYGQQFGEDLQQFIAINDKLGFVFIFDLIICIFFLCVNQIDVVNYLNLVELNMRVLDIV
jgi:hypothetical protein